MPNWPTQKLEDTLGSSVCKPGKQIDIWLAPDVEDVTHDPEVRQQLKDYAPDIRQIGLGLYNERRGRLSSLRTWGGLLVRGLETRPETAAIQEQRRCLQYIYIWTKQKSAVSFFWMILVPLLMGVWGLLIHYFYAPLIVTFLAAFQQDMLGALFPLSDNMLPLYATGGLSLPLLGSGIWDHRRDLKLGSGIYFRGTTLLIPFSLLMWFVVFSWIIPWIIIGFAVFVCGIYWLLDQVGLTDTSHSMDYLPVFIWLKETATKGWKFEKAFWDCHHYKIESTEATENDDSKEEKRIRLQMDNPWHSVRLGGYVQDIYLTLSIIGLVFFIPIALRILESGLYTDFYNSGFLFVISCGMVVLGFRTIMRASSELTNDDEIQELQLPESPSELNLFNDKTKNHLSEKRLKQLWNLVQKRDTGKDKSTSDIRPRFVIITKIQDPFNYYNLDDYDNTFRDDLDYLYLYITTRCPMTEEDRRRSLELKIEVLSQGYHMKDSRAQMAYEVTLKRALRDNIDVKDLTEKLVKTIDPSKRDISLEEVEEFDEDYK